MRQSFIWAAIAALFLSACGDKTDKPADAAKPPVVANAAAPLPDVGKLETVTVTAFGLGASPGEAMAQALQMALLQVNGAVMQSESVSTKYGLDVTLNRDSASLRASEFVEQLRQRSGGVIQAMRVVSLDEPTLGIGKRYKYTIEADISKFKPSAEMQKIKVVIGQIRFGQANVPMGGQSVSSAELSGNLRQRISDALVQTGRFAVLDREFSPEIEQELDIISSGQAPSAELAKLSQAASADLVWSARVSNFAYNRHARQLRAADRELVSYSGGWAMTQKLVNVATRQVMLSDSLGGTAPSTAPTTMGSGVDGGRVMNDMADELVKGVVASILQRTFPITVIAREGNNVVLSQGGQAVKQGGRYAMVAMGSEMKDPQTGQSLGRMESPCCELVIDRVTPNLSYGRLENVYSNLDELPVAGLQVRSEMKGGARPSAQAAAAAGDAPAAPAAGKPAATKRRAEPAEHAPEAPVGKQNDDKW